MRSNSSAESALHIVLLLASAPREMEFSSADLAAFHNLSPSAFAKVLQQLTAAGIVAGTAGRSGGYRLARKPADITVLDVVAALDGVEPQFHCREIRRQGSCAAASGYSARCVIARTMDIATEAWRTSLAGVSIQDLAATTRDEVPVRTIRLTGKWIEDHGRTAKN